MGEKKNLLIIGFICLIMISPLIIDLDVGIIDSENERIPNSSNDFVHEVKYLIITNETMLSPLISLAEWKAQKGLRTEIIDVEDISDDYTGRDLPEKIKNCIKDFYENNATTWVLLAGDFDGVPSRNVYAPEEYPRDGDTVSCDSYYTDLNNDWDSNDDDLWGSDDDDKDFVAEVYVGRLTANNADEMNLLVQNIINYEANPDVGPWMTRALYAGAMLAFDQDWNGDDEVDYGECDANRQHNFLANRLPSDWTSLLMAEVEGLKNSSYYYDTPLEEMSLRQEIDKGYSLGMIVGHGSQSGMIRLTFEVDYDGDELFDYTADPYFEGGLAIDAHLHSPLINLNTIISPINNHLGMYYLGGCSVGTFDEDYDCLSEYFLKQAAIGCIAASEVVWGEDQWDEREHGGWYSEGLSSRFFEQLFINNQPGKAFAYAKADYISDREIIGIDDDKGYFPQWEDKIIKQFNLLGDPEVNLWQTIPEKLNITQISSSSNITSNFVVTMDNDSISEICVTAVRGSELIWKGFSDENGEVEIPVSSEELEYMTITASKNQFIPSIIPNQKEYIPPEEKNKIPGYNSISFLGFFVFGIIFVYIKHIKHTKHTKHIQYNKM